MTLRVNHCGDIHLDEDRYFGDTAQCLEWFVSKRSGQISSPSAREKDRVHFEARLLVSHSRRAILRGPDYIPRFPPAEMRR